MIDTIFKDFYTTLIYMSVYSIVFFLSKYFYQYTHGIKVDNELTFKDNFAAAVSQAGYYVAITIIFITTLSGKTVSLKTDLLSVLGYQFLGMVLLTISHYLNDWLILRKSNIKTELLEKKNVSIGLIQFSTCIASSLIISSSVSGEGGGVGTVLVFFILGQLLLLVASEVFNLTTKYDIHEELSSQNLAASFGFSGTLIATALILMMGISGSFMSWKESLMSMAIYSSMGLLFLPIYRFLFDKIILLKADINNEIKNDRNIGAGILEGLCTICFALEPIQKLQLV